MVKNNIIKLINQISSDSTQSTIKDISFIMMENLEFIKQYLSNNENRIEPLEEPTIEINLQYYTKE